MDSSLCHLFLSEMRTIQINAEKGGDVLKSMALALKGTIIEKWGEHILQFDNEHGKGVIKSISFDWGVTLFDYDVDLTEDMKLVVSENDTFTIEFVFISQGSLKFSSGMSNEWLNLERYQNIIVSPKLGESQTFIFPSNANVKVNLIRIVTKDYQKKKNHNLSYLNELLLSIFKEVPTQLPYSHLGNYNLSIADEVQKLHSNEQEGMVRTLSLEGRLNLILAMQILEHQNLVTQQVMPDSFSHEEIKRIHQLTKYIAENIEEHVTVTKLAKEAGMNPKKLQAGFNLLFSKSVNGYVRQLKLELARDYLKNSDLTISEIVFKIGLKSRSYFSKIFFEKYGILPNAYRQKVSKFI